MLQSLAGSSCVRLVEQHRSAWCFALLVLGYLLYLVFGAVVFSSVELPYEDLLRQELAKLKQRFLEDHACLSEEQLEQFLMRVLEASNYGVSVLSNASGNWNWDFTSSLFFASTVLSTTVRFALLKLPSDEKPAQQLSTVRFEGYNIIEENWSSTILNDLSWKSKLPLLVLGYGHTVPLSDGGKAFCIIYSVIGIPFTLLFLTAVVQRIIVYVTRRPVLYFHIRWGFSKQVVAIIHAMVLGFITVSFFFLIPAAIFSVLEDDWNFLESFYFCFISLSTIGLGDYVPGEGYNQKFRELYKVGITCYLLMGLIAMLVVLETFCELHELKKFRKLFYVKKDKEEDQVHIMEHDQLSFSSISDQAASMKDDQKANEPFVNSQSPTSNDSSLNN
ncbi:Potassium channel subfamily K member 1 [Willisornis vidua]|uniref:Potassium channel subfamily K member n=1 Tax=Willisornis vidua TaxID=1566151 RepID=A0ABQ9DCB4_9PASS|nr:Potassium channel subfamily K member 1 [Willisornis vidua]